MKEQYEVGKEYVVTSPGVILFGKNAGGLIVECVSKDTGAGAEFKSPKLNKHFFLCAGEAKLLAESKPKEESAPLRFEARDVITIDFGVYKAHHHWSVQKVTEHSFFICDEGRQMPSQAKGVIEIFWASEVAKSASLSRYAVGDRIVIGEGPPSFVTESNEKWFRVCARTGSIYWNSFTHKKSRPVSEIPYEVGDVVVIDLAIFKERGEMFVTKVTSEMFATDKLSYPVHWDSTAGRASRLIRIAKTSAQKLTEENPIEEYTNILGREKEKDMSWTEVLVTKDTKTYTRPIGSKVEDTAHSLVDITLEVEAAQLQAQYERKIKAHKLKLAAIKDGTKSLNGWWTATIDMTPLSLTAIMAFVAGISALTASLIPLIGG